MSAIRCSVKHAVYLDAFTDDQSIGFSSVCCASFLGEDQSPEIASSECANAASGGVVDLDALGLACDSVNLPSLHLERWCGTSNGARNT
jgi:hypothetical protein